MEVGRPVNDTKKTAQRGELCITFLKEHASIAVSCFRHEELNRFSST